MRHFFSGKHLKNQKFYERHYARINRQLKDLVNKYFDVVMCSVYTQDKHSEKADEHHDFSAKITVAEVIAAIGSQKTAGKSQDGGSFTIRC